MNANDWLRTASFKKLLAAYIVKRLAEEGRPMHIARIKNELSEPRGIIDEIVDGLKKANMLKFVSCEGEISLNLSADCPKKRRRAKK